MLCLLGTFSRSALAQTETLIDDPFFGRKGNGMAVSAFNQVVETVDPFSGNVSLTHTDVVLPGNGGLDLKIIRTYNSRIWNQLGFTNTAFLPDYEPAWVGAGWQLHMGRVRHPDWNGCATSDCNPTVEMPDGSEHHLFRDPSGTGFISKEYWKYKYNTTSNIYELTLTDGTVYEFDFAAPNNFGTGDRIGVTRIRDTHGNHIDITYQQVGSLGQWTGIKQITDTAGRVITFTMDSATGLLKTMTVNGNNYTYTFTNTGSSSFKRNVLTQVKPPVGPAWKYTYRTADPGLLELSALTYPSGGVLTYTYTSTPFKVDRVTTFNYYAVTKRVLSGVQSTSTTTYSYNSGTSSGDVTTVSTTGCKTEVYTHFAWGQISSQTSNLLWKIGLLTKKQTKSGSTVVETITNTWNPSIAISNDQFTNWGWGSYEYHYDDDVWVPQLASRAIARDGKTYTTTYSNYDAYSNPKTITETGDATRTTALTWYTNTSTNVVKDHPASEAVTVSGETFTTSYTYDTSGNGDLKQINRYGVVTDFTYEATGNLDTEKNARGDTTRYDYAYGLVSNIYNPIYSIRRSIDFGTGTIESETNGRGHTTYFNYDLQNRLTSIRPPLEATTTITYDNTSGKWKKETKDTFTIQTNFDGIGRVTSTNQSEGINTATTYNACGDATFRSYPYTTTSTGDSFVYDVLGRVTKITHPDAKTVQYSYSGSNVTVTNERSIAITYGYQAFGNPDEKRLLTVADVTGTTSYTYNTVGSLKTISQPGSVSRSFGYNTKNFLTSETHPETGQITYGRDAVGNMSSRMDGKGTTDFTYDELNRLKTINFPGTSDDASFIYDDADNMTDANNPTVTLSMNYDSENRMTSQTMRIDGKSYTTDYSVYDSRGNIKSMGYPTGRTVSYNYDNANRISSITGFLTSIDYHPSGGISSLDFTGSLTVSNGYDNRYRLSGISASGKVDLTYGYDGVGNVTSITDNRDNSRTRGMTYDNVDRLLTASGIWGSLTYAYSATGNQNSKTLNGVSTTYAYTSHRLTSATGGEPASYGYDANANITSNSLHTFTYDYGNRLQTVDGMAVTYVYDALDRRVKKITSAGTLIYNYDQYGNNITEQNLTTGALREYIFSKRLPVAEVRTR